jgi:hypothetical protein
MSDNNIPIAPVPVIATGPVVLVKTVATRSAVPGKTVEIQCVIICDEDGEEVDVLTEVTGQQILAMLRDIRNILSTSTGILGDPNQR